ncbi:MAG: methyltransferase [Flavobacteriaceae bacterium]|nr:methyltransferase [Flavobacteriaceae bacterium]
MANQPFKFKQFLVHQDKCAMKIGTDAVLLGAWASLEHDPKSILDIGSGTGILALMLAQRCPAQIIDAIEIDSDAYEQCVENFENSIWSDRLFCYHASLQEYCEEFEDKYDLIICNPPFYDDNYRSENSQRDLARFQDAMPFELLIVCISKLLSKSGIFSVIIPFNKENYFIDLASNYNLFPNRILHVKGNPSSKIVRSLIEFSIYTSEIKIKELIIETSRHQYTQEYINLTKDFYLKM